MGETLRKACPCLEVLWQRIFGKKSSDGVDVEDHERDPSPTPQPPQPPPPGDKPVESGSIYMALWSFESRHPDELSFQEGDLFSVIGRAGDWWTARKIDRNGRVLAKGIVPSNYLARGESVDAQP